MTGTTRRKDPRTRPASVESGPAIHVGRAAAPGLPTQDGATAWDLMSEDHGDEAAVALEAAFESGKRWRRRQLLVEFQVSLRRSRG